MEQFTRDQAKHAYYCMLLSRNYENCVNKMYKEKRIKEKPLSGVGQEATSVGAVLPLGAGDFVVPSLRSKGAYFAKGVTVNECMLQLFRKRESHSGGVWTAHHMGVKEKGVMLSSALVASSMSVASGIALAEKLKGSDRVVVVFFGDGATSRADFHTSINFSAVLDLPIVFICENNRYALSTSISQQMKNEDIASRAIGYGIPGETVDGQNVSDVYRAANKAVEQARSGKGPSLIVCNTYRFRGHTESHDCIDGRPEEEFNIWTRRCPLAMFEQELLLEYGVTQEEIQELKNRVDKEIAEAVQMAEMGTDPLIEDALAYVYAE